MERRSEVVWISHISGPMEIISRSGSFPARIPHSTPAWIASIFGFFPYISWNSAAALSRKGESFRYSPLAWIVHVADEAATFMLDRGAPET